MFQPNQLSTSTYLPSDYHFNRLTYVIGENYQVIVWKMLVYHLTQKTLENCVDVRMQ